MINRRFEHAADIHTTNSIQTKAILIVSVILHVKLNISIKATFFHEIALITPPTGETFHPWETMLILNEDGVLYDDQWKLKQYFKLTTRELVLI